jgi:hypothetical protein
MSPTTADDPPAGLVEPVRIAHQGAADLPHLLPGDPFPFPVVEVAHGRIDHGRQQPHHGQHHQHLQQGEAG